MVRTGQWCDVDDDEDFTNMNLLLMVSLGLAVVASSRVVRDRKMGGGGGCGLACYRYNKCRDNSSGSNISSAEGNLRYRPHLILHYIEQRHSVNKIRW